jgi:hypothetical protein
MFHPRFFKTLAIGAAMICMAAFLWPSMSCAAGKKDRKARAAQEEKSQQISRLELQNDLMRFAKIFIRGFQASLLPLVDGNDSTAVRFALSDAELRGVNTVLTIVTGPDAVTNLLDYPAHHRRNRDLRYTGSTGNHEAPGGHRSVDGGHREHRRHRQKLSGSARQRAGETGKGSAPV